MHDRHLVKLILNSCIFSDHLHDTTCLNDHTFHIDMLIQEHDKFILNLQLSNLGLKSLSSLFCALHVNYQSITVSTPIMFIDNRHDQISILISHLLS